MNTTDPELRRLVKSLVKVMNSLFEFQPLLLKLIIDASPSLSDFQKKDLLEKLESVMTAYTLLRRQSDELLPS